MHKLLRPLAILHEYRCGVIVVRLLELLFSFVRTITHKKVWIHIRHYQKKIEDKLLSQLHRYRLPTWVIDTEGLGRHNVACHHVGVCVS